MARELTLRIIIEQPPGVDFGLQKGSGSVYETVQKQHSQGKDLVFEFQPSIRDGLYRPLLEDNKTLLDNGTVYSSVIDTETATWEFPLLAKYRFRLGRVNPFVQAGPSFRLPVRSLSADGMTAGTGVEMRWHALHIAPSFRFTRWGAGNALASSGGAFGGPALAAR